MMDFDQEYIRSKLMKYGDEPLDMVRDEDGMMRYVVPSGELEATGDMAAAVQEEKMLPAVEVIEKRDMPVSSSAKPKAKPAPAMPTQGQLDLGEAKPVAPTNAMGTLKKVGELIQSGAEKIDFGVLGLPGIGTLTLKDLTVGDLGKVLVDIAEGFPPITGKGETLKPTMEAIELVNVAPAAGAAYKAGKKIAPKIAKELGPTVNKMAEDYLRKTGGIMDVAPAGPRVDSIERFPVGPSSIKPKVIAADKPLYREMNVDSLTDFLREERQFSYAPVFVTDNADLALGQGANKGIVVKFRANSVSGEPHAKPMTGELAGREYKADVFAPKSIESITFKSEADIKKVRSLAAQVLKTQFERVTEGKNNIVFVRKAQSQEKK